MTEQTLVQAYQIAQERYAEFGVDVDSALSQLQTIPVSLHCWQGDDVGGFETAGAELSGGGIRPPATTPARRAPSTSFAPTSRRPSA